LLDPIGLLGLANGQSIDQALLPAEPEDEKVAPPMIEDARSLLNVARDWLAKQWRCRGTFQFHPHQEYPPLSPCSVVLHTSPRERIATHHEPCTDLPTLCAECAAWSLEYNDHALAPRHDLPEVRAMEALVNTLDPGIQRLQQFIAKLGPASEDGEMDDDTLDTLFRDLPGEDEELEAPPCDTSVCAPAWCNGGPTVCQVLRAPYLRRTCHFIAVWLMELAGKQAGNRCPEAPHAGL